MKYKTKVIEIGGSLYLPLPKVIATTLGIAKGDRVENEATRVEMWSS